MKMIKRVLLPTDFSRPSRGAMEMAISLAEKFNSEITLLHVLPGFSKSKEVIDVLKKTAQDQFKAISKKINSSGGKATELVIATGSYFDQIIQHAEKQDVNLILMDSGKKESAEKYKLSTTVSKVVRKSNKPVWVMKWNMPASIKRIICPVDFSRPSRRALTNAIHLARVFQSELTVLNVIAPLTDIPSSRNAQHNTEQRLISEEQTSEFERFLKEFNFHNVKLLKEIYQGKPYKEILKRINAHKSDLLVMGTTGRTGLSRILMGSVTEKVVREVPCSFITLKDEDVIRLCLETKIKDLEVNFRESNQLMAKGFAKEALNQFQLCLNIDCLYIPAWEGMASAHEQLGHKEEAQNCRNKIKEIHERLKQEQVELDLHRHLPFFKR